MKNKYNLIVAFPAMIFLLILITHPEMSFSQGIGISTVAITPDPSSVLEMRSNSQGVLVPRMTGAERDLIAAPAAGLLIYNTTTLEFNYYQGGWKAITAGGVTSVSGSGNIASSGGSTPNLTFAGNLQVTNLNSGTLASATTFWRGDGTWVSPSATNLSGIVPVVNGGTGLSAGISGGIVGYTAAGTLASSPLLTSKALIIGGGAGFTPTALTLGALNQMVGMNAAGNANEYKTLSGIANQISVTHTANAISLSTPQNIHTGAAPTFAGLTLSGLTANSFLYPNGTKAITSTAAATNGQLLIGSTGVAPVAANLTAGNGIAITNGAGSVSINMALGTTNQLLGMNAAGTATEYKTIAGTANQINLVQGVNTITLSTPQNIDLTALPTFAGLTLSGLTANSFLYPNGTKAITSTAAATNGQLLIGSTGVAPVAANLTAGNGIAITNGAGSVSIGMVLGTTNQLLGMNAAGTATEYKTIAGTANQINLVHGVNTITLSTPQNIHTAALPTFAGLTLSGLTANSFLYPNGIKAVTSTAAATNGQLLIGSTGVAPVAANLTAGNGIAITNGAGSVTIDNAIPVTEVSSTTAFTSTSATFTTATGMSIAAPSSGDYMVWFSTSLTNSNANRIVNISLFLNNTQVLASERFYEIAGARLETPCSTQAFLSGVIAGQVIDLRWKNSGNTGTMDQRTLTIMRIK